MQHAPPRATRHRGSTPITHPENRHWQDAPLGSRPRRRHGRKVRSDGRGQLEIEKRTDGPPGVGTIFASTVKDAGMKTKREFKLTEFEAPTRIRWSEISKNAVMAPEGQRRRLRQLDQARHRVGSLLTYA
jgi:hypothetical protein